MMEQHKTAIAVLFLLVAVSCGSAAQVGEAYAVNSEKSDLQISVYKEGLLKAFGHDHRISAKISSGRVVLNEETLEDSLVDLTIEATSLNVIDPGESDKNRLQIQSTMAGKDVLDEERFPEIRFTSIRVKQGRKSDKGWEILLQGMLTLHGVEKEISLPLQFDAKDGTLHAEGEVSLLQTDFGIVPIKIAGGSVKVRNKVRIHFDVVADRSRP